MAGNSHSPKQLGGGARTRRIIRIRNHRVHTLFEWDDGTAARRDSRGPRDYRRSLGGISDGAARDLVSMVRFCNCSSGPPNRIATDRKTTRLNSSHLGISYAVFCLKKKKYSS